MVENLSTQTTPATLPCHLKSALASVFMPLGAVVIGGVLYGISPGILLIFLALAFLVGILSFGLSMFSIIGAYRRRMSGTFVLGLCGFVLSSSLGFYSFSILSFFLTWHGC